MTVRLEPALLEWVRTQGGAGWVRRLLRALQALAHDERPAAQKLWRRLQGAAGGEGTEDG